MLSQQVFLGFQGPPSEPQATMFAPANFIPNMPSPVGPKLLATSSIGQMNMPSLPMPMVPLPHSSILTVKAEWTPAVMPSYDVAAMSCIPQNGATMNREARVMRWG